MPSSTSRDPRVAKPAALTALAIPLVLACGAGAEPGGPDVDDVPAWVLEEELRIGSLDDPDLGFSQIRRLVRDAAGELYVLESRDRQVRVYNEEGRRLRSFGRQGRGPGELEQPVSFGVVGDTVWVSDMGNRRMTLFTIDGRHLGDVPWGDVRVQGERGMSVIVFPDTLQPDGTFRSAPLSMIAIGLGSEERPDTVPFPRLRFDAAGTVLDTIRWDTAAAPLMRSVRVGEVVVPINTAVFPDQPLSSTAPTGRRVIVERPAAQSGGRSRFSVTVLEAAGDTAWSRTFAYLPASVEPEQADSVVAAAGSTLRNRGVDSLTARRAVLDVLALPGFLPPVTAVNHVTNGEIWLRREQDRAEEWRWTILSPEGEPVGELRSPRGLTFHVIEPDRAWGVFTDEFGVPWVVRYRIRRS